MNPQEPQNRENPQTFVPDQQGQPSIVPLQNNAPATQIQPSVPVAQPVTPSQPPIAVSPTPVFNQSDALAVAKPKRRKKWLIISGVVVLALITLLTIFMLVMDSFYGLKKTTFDNGIGSKYELVFYPKHRVESAKLENKNQVNLVSEAPPVDGKAPVALFMKGGDKLNENDWNKNPTRNCSGSSPEAFMVHNDEIGQDIHMCILSKEGENEVGYIGAYRYKDKLHVLIVIQDIDLDTANLEESEKHHASEIGLQVYRNDIKEIVKSIRPLD